MLGDRDTCVNNSRYIIEEWPEVEFSYFSTASAMH